MWSAGRLYGLAFSEITGKVPVFHPDVRDVGGQRCDHRRAPRPVLSRQLGAAGQALRRLGIQLPHAAPAERRRHRHHVEQQQLHSRRAGEPVLISQNDAETLFHEFGHSLHALLQDITYPSLATTPRDFVEFPSQVYEQWLMTPEVLDRFARHHKTKEPIPPALMKRLEELQTFNQGYATVEYLAAAILDMDLHLIPDGDVDPAAFEREGLKRIGMPREIALRHRLPHFNHLFTSDAYSAGYYSYLWSDVMAADAWQAFVEAGSPWDPKVAGPDAPLHPLGGERARPCRGVSPLPRPRPGRPRAAARAGVPGEEVTTIARRGRQPSPLGGTLWLWRRRFSGSSRRFNSASRS
jgi:peptidyl-dipeptidase Dcp